MPPTITTPDFHCISLYSSQRKARHCVLLLHGITSEHTEGGLYTSITEALSKQEIDSTSFDFRGHGESHIAFTDATPAGMVLDFTTVYLHLTDIYEEISLVCASFGASIALLASSSLPLNKTKKIVMLNPVTSYENTFLKAETIWGRHFFPQISDEDFWRINTFEAKECALTLGREMMSQIALMRPEKVEIDNKIAITILHGTKDTIVSIQQSEAFEQRNFTCVNLIKIPNADHGFEGFEVDIIQKTLNSLVG